MTKPEKEKGKQPITCTGNQKVVEKTDLALQYLLKGKGTTLRRVNKFFDLMCCLTMPMRKPSCWKRKSLKALSSVRMTVIMQGITCTHISKHKTVLATKTLLQLKIKI